MKRGWQLRSSQLRLASWLAGMADTRWTYSTLLLFGCFRFVSERGKKRNETSRPLGTLVMSRVALFLDCVRSHRLNAEGKPRSLRSRGVKRAAPGPTGGRRRWLFPAKRVCRLFFPLPWHIQKRTVLRNRRIRRRCTAWIRPEHSRL